MSVDENAALKTPKTDFELEDQIKSYDDTHHIRVESLCQLCFASPVSSACCV